MKTWRKPKEFVCDVCKADFDKESKIKRHMMDAHQKEYIKKKKEKQ
jgi:hypothetical protein